MDALSPAVDVAAAELKALKATLRAAALARRDGLSAAHRAAAAEAIAARVGELPLAPAGAVVSGFLAIRSEIDPRLLLDALYARGFPLALPVILADRTTMQFRAWTPGEPLSPSGFGLSVPPDGAPVVEPAIMLVPLAAFDRRGYRIGYGKGHYDRAIALIEARRPLLKIGVAFADQEIATVPAEAHDRPLDFILSETELFACGAPTR